MGKVKIIKKEMIEISFIHFILFIYFGFNSISQAETVREVPYCNGSWKYVHSDHGHNTMECFNARWELDRFVTENGLNTMRNSLKEMIENNKVFVVNEKLELKKEIEFLKEMIISNLGIIENSYQMKMDILSENIEKIIHSQLNSIKDQLHQIKEERKELLERISQLEQDQKNVGHE